MVRLRARLAAVVAVALLASAVPVTAFAQDAKAHLAEGDKAARAKDWTKALAEYEAANQATPSAEALEGVANAHYMLKHDGDAWLAYTQYVKQYGANVPKNKKALADARVKELEVKTGGLDLQVSETGAQVSVDDKPAGTTPLAAPLRLSPGPHKIRVTKDGFLPFESAPNVTTANVSALQVRLEAQSTKGRITVKERQNRPIRVVVDNVDMGDSPWFGDVSVGDHDVAGRGPAMVAPAQKVHVDPGKTVDVVLDAHSSTAPVRISTNDGKGVIYLDDKVVGEGTFAGDIGAGPHKLRIVREGFDPFEEQIDLKENEPFSRSVTLNVGSQVKTTQIEKEGRRLEGIYGGFGLLGSTLLGGMKSSIQKSCTEGRPAEETGCDEGNGLGAGLNGFIGYHFDPVGVELFFAAHYDSSSPKLTWAGTSTDPGFGPDPARTEDFTIIRASGLAALRIRLTLQGEKVRFTMATGVGLAYALMGMKRETTAAADASIKDVYSADAQHYLSPVLSVEPALHYRLSPTFSLGIGLELLVENPEVFSQTPTTPPDRTRHLGPVGLTTRAYDLATGPQVFFGPFIGIMFGP